MLWSCRTTPKSETQKTPLSLTYVSETVVPVEFLTPSPCMAAFAVEADEEERRVDLDLVEEKRDPAAAKIALYKNILTNYYKLGSDTYDLVREISCSEKIRLVELKFRAN